MTSAPQRIQLGRTAGWRMPENTVKVDRTTFWGNPWVPGTNAMFRLPMDAHPWFLQEEDLLRSLEVAESVDCFRLFVEGRPIPPAVLPVKHLGQGRAQLGMTLALDLRRKRILARLPELRGRNLACWCPPGCACHADVLLELANRGRAR